MDLFDIAGAERAESNRGTSRDRSPLAVRMRPRTLDEVAGQAHLLTPGSPLRQLVVPGNDTGPTSAASVILWGPPGTGKTTLAYLIAGAAGRRFVELSAVTAGVKDVRAVIEEAKRRTALSGEETVLFIDEVHRFTSTQQDSLLPAVENRWVTLVAATTENPYFCVNSPLLSRSLLLTLQPLSEDDIADLVHRAIADERGLRGEVTLSDEAMEHLLRLAGGDARRALTVLEASAGAALSNAPVPLGEGEREPIDVDLETVEKAIDQAAVRYDRQGDQHYDVISAFIKSMRGSDVDGALHYLARMIVAGEDPRFIARRIMIAASEEVAMADPTALQTAVAAAQAVALIGMPEGRIILAQAVVHVATAPKSNASYMALDAALADVRAGKVGMVPEHLRDGHYKGAKGLGHGVGYKYAHDEPHAVAEQEYLPEILRGTEYYHPSDRGLEREIAPRLARIRAILHGRRDARS